MRVCRLRPLPRPLPPQSGGLTPPTLKIHTSPQHLPERTGAGEAVVNVGHQEETGATVGEVVGGVVCEVVGGVDSGVDSRAIGKIPNERTSETISNEIVEAIGRATGEMTGAVTGGALGGTGHVAMTTAAAGAAATTDRASAVAAPSGEGRGLSPPALWQHCVTSGRGMWCTG